MESAELERTTVEIDANVNGGPYKLVNLRATGTVVKFDGFLTLYNESRDDDFEDEDARRLPAMNQGEALKKNELKIDQHFTEPPPRFSEASLVKRMEELGIGRPSTYASILQVLRDRTYTRLDKKRIIPEDKGRIVVAFLESYFPRYVEYDFTADLEGKLDEIANHELDYKSVLREFWTGFTGAVAETKDLRISEVIDVLDALLNEHNFPLKADGSDARACPQCGNGRLGLKVGKFGAFIGCSNYPECRFTRALTAPGEGELSATKELGEDPESKKMVTLRSGRFGPYIQLGEAEDTGEKTKKGGKPILSKPKRASIPKNFDPHELDFDTAISLLQLPREVGKHPESGEPIVAGYGRFGPYVKHQDTYASLSSDDEVFSVGLNRAVTLIAEKIARGPGRGRRGKPAGRALGDHPALGGPVTQHEGKYGPYVSHNKVNATIPSSSDPATVTLEEAVALIDARAGKGGGKKAAKPKKEKKAKEANGSGEEAAEKPKKKAAPRKKAAPKTKSNGADETAKSDE
jgi:DNA topoisomerase-1